MWELFFVFLKIGFISFGGGYTVLPVLQREAASHQWMNNTQFQEIVTISGSAPGPIVTNSATLIGLYTAGLPGAIVSTIGIVLPSLIVVVLLATMLLRNAESQWLKSSLYGLRPVVTGLIIYACIHFGFMSGAVPVVSWMTLLTLLICTASFLALVKYKVNPFTVIVCSGIAGIVFF
ncbi:Chromate transport protein [compost metagenome]